MVFVLYELACPAQEVFLLQSEALCSCLFCSSFPARVLDATNFVLRSVFSAVLLMLFVQLV
jgi:hypothetical protein